MSGLAIYVRAGKERAVALRLICLDLTAAFFELFSCSPQDYVVPAICAITATWTRVWSHAAGPEESAAECGEE